jgi:hypothetical protein
MAVKARKKNQKKASIGNARQERKKIIEELGHRTDWAKRVTKRKEKKVLPLSKRVKRSLPN